MDDARTAEEMERIFAKDLGEAMVALSRLINVAGGLTLGPSIEVTTEVEASFKRGSFSFVVVSGAAQDFANQLLQSFTMKDLLTIEASAAAAAVSSASWVNGTACSASWTWGPLRFRD